MAGGPPLVRRAGVQVRRRARSVFDLPGDRSRRGIKSCNPKNQIWDESRNKWYLSHSGCGIKSGIHTTFRLARACTLRSRCECSRVAQRVLRYGDMEYVMLHLIFIYLTPGEGQPAAHAASDL